MSSKSDLGPCEKRRWKHMDSWLVVAICAAAAVVLGKDIDRGALADADAAAHVMDGVLIHDWVMAGPKAWTAPMAFAERQYAHYPTLGIGRHYPPGFAIVEAGFFAIFGVSPTTARLCVAFFGMLAAVGTLVFVRQFAGRAPAIIAALTLLAFPATTLWGRQAMLEVPTMAALAWGAVCFVYYVRSPNGCRLAILIVAATCAVLFKQSGVFLVCAVAMALTALCIGGVVPFRHALVSGICGAVTLLAVVLSMDELCLKTVSGYGTYPDAWSWAALTFHARAMPYLTGTLILIPAVVGGILGFRRLGAGQWLLLAWVLTSYIMATAADLKVPRFFYVGVLPIAVWAGLGLAWGAARISRIRLGGAAVAAIALGLVFAGYRRPVSDPPDYSPIVDAHREQLRNRPVLFSGLRDGDFVFAVRRHLPRGEGLVIRGSKLLYTCTAGPNLDFVSYADDQTSVAAVMRRLAFEYVFVERENVVGTEQDGWLREYLASSGDYRLIAEHEFPADQRYCRMAGTVDVYQLAAPMQRTVDYVDLPMPRTGQPIRVSLGASSPITDGPS